MKSSARSIAIAQLIYQNYENGGSYISVGDIANELGVSSKTVSRELVEVEQVLEHCGMRLVKKTGSGICCQGNLQSIAALQKFLQDGASEYIYTPKERQLIIVGRLLSNEEPIKLFVLASLLQVTDGTISNDLDKLEEWFENHQLRLVRKPGLGVYVAGDEQCIRKAIVCYIYENIDEGKLLSLIQQNLSSDDDKQAKGDKVTGFLLELMDQHVIHRIEAFVRQLEKKLEYHLSDNAFIGIVVHLSLAVQRIKKNEKIVMNKELLAELAQKREFTVAAQMAEQLAAEFAILVPEDEIGYITMHLLGARNRYRKGAVSVSVIDNFHLVKMAKSIMRIAQQETGQTLLNNQNLLIGLVNHLGPSISRLKMNMEIRNPLLEKMREEYADLMALSHKCIGEVETALGMTLPESEIAYIAMHLGAALEDSDRLLQVPCKVIVACPTGMGTSRLLSSRIRKEYNNIHVIEQVSTLSITEEYLAQTDASFIVSTVPMMNCRLPVVVVNALLNKEGKALIDQQLASIGSDAGRAEVPVRQADDFQAELIQLTEYNHAILEILKFFFFMDESQLCRIEELCRKIGEFAGITVNDSRQICQDLLERESYGGTSIYGRNMMILHCRSNGVRHLYFGIVHVGEKFTYSSAENQEKVRTVIVMLAPKNSTASELETIGHISSILLERWGFIELLHEGNQSLIYQEIVEILQEFLREKYKMMMEE